MKKLYVFAAAVLALCTFASCDKTPEGPNTPNGKAEITVAKDALVAYFPMEDATEYISKLTPKDQGTGSEANFVEGRTGKCYQGTKGSYLVYDLPADSKIKEMKAFTLSFWLNGPEVTEAPVPMYFQVSSDDLFWGCMSVSVDRTAVGDGYLTLKNCFRYNENGAFWKTYADEYDKCWTAARWIHVVYSYDAVKSEFHAFANGAEVTPEGAVACTDWTAAETTPAGNLNWSTASGLNIGAWLPKLVNGATDEWMGDLENVKLDEMRLYNRGLSAEEVAELYRAEIANINE